MSATIAESPRIANFSQDPIYLVLETDQMTGATPPYTPTGDNLKSYIQIYKRTDAASEYLTKVSASYSTQTKQTRFDLSNILHDELIPPIPTVPVVEDTALTVRQTTDNILTAYGIIGEQLGIPAVNNTSNSTGDFTVIRGSTKYWQGFGADADLQDWYLLHSYKAYIYGKLQQVAKNISKTQTELLYFYCRVTTVVTVNISAVGENGTYTYDRAFSITPGINYIYAGYKQLGIEAQANGDNILSYTLTFTNMPSRFNTLLYTIDQTVSDYDITLLYENGCGALEPVRMSGRHEEESLKVTKQTNESTRWAGIDFVTGTSTSHNATGRPTITIYSGNYSHGYITHLKQIIYSDVWLEDPTTRKLYKWTVQTKEINPATDTPDLYNIELTLVLGIDQKSANTFNI